MNEQLLELKRKALCTEYAQWRRVLSSVFIGIIAVLPVMVLWHLYYTGDNVSCLKMPFYLSFPWLISQLIVIAYLYFYKEMPAIVRNAIKMMIGFGNMWFIFYLLSINVCS